MERHEDVEEESSAPPRISWSSPLRGFLRSGRSFASWGKAKVTRRKQVGRDTFQEEQEPQAADGPSQPRWELISLYILSRLFEQCFNLSRQFSINLLDRKENCSAAHAGGLLHCPMSAL